MHHWQNSWVKKKNGKEYNAQTHKTHLKIQMVIGILCNIKSQKCTFLQNMIGLSLFAGGVKDRICDLLAMYGLTTTSRTIRNLIQKWSDKRNLISEIDKTKFWRFSFDNLNFLRKYANTFKLGCKFIGRMLNLLTGQVNHRSSEVIASHSLDDELDSTNKTFAEEDFFGVSDNEKSAWDDYIGSIFSVAHDRKDKGTNTIPTSFIEDLQHHLPDFSPPEPDINAFARIDLAESTSCQDISDYLMKSKADLKIGEPGFPKHLLVVGDQQTFSLVKKLKSSHPDLFNWIIPYPGDWHLLKLAAETIRDIVVDGGYSDMAN